MGIYCVRQGIVASKNIVSFYMRLYLIIYCHRCLTLNFNPEFKQQVRQFWQQLLYILCANNNMHHYFDLFLRNAKRKKEAKYGINMC